MKIANALKCTKSESYNVNSKISNIAIGVLKKNTSKSNIHNYETMMYIIQGEGYSKVGEEIINWNTGDIIFIPSMVWHQHFSVGEACRYFVVENMEMLQTLGIPIYREEKNEK